MLLGVEPGVELEANATGTDVATGIVSSPPADEPSQS